MSYRQITMEQAKDIFQTTGDYIILDVRTPGEYKLGHIPKSINLPNERIGVEDPVELPNKEQQIYVYCRSGNRSRRAAEKLVNMGYSNIIESGGIMSWEGEIEK